MSAPNTSYLEFNFVKENATGRGLNTQFIMENLGNGTFRVTDGRVGIKVGPHKPKVYTKPMSDWEMFYEMKIARGYLLTKTSKMAAKKIVKDAFASITDEEVKEIVKRLMDYANQVIAENYSVTIENVSDEMLRYGKKILDDLADNYKTMSVATFNNKLKVLYAAIPRRIDKLSDCLASQKSDFNDIVSNEQELFEILVGQLKEAKSEEKENSFLDQYNLTWRTVTESEEAEIKEMLGTESSHYMRAWRVENTRTAKNFSDFCRKEGLTEEKGITNLFHGSRNENFWSIITNGLTVNPKGVVITGKMFGNGTYYAKDADKSLGYTSRSGSKWAKGVQSSGFLGIYKVATGKTYDISRAESDLNAQVLEKRCPGAHSTWAHAGEHLYKDEIITYRDDQSTIKYLVEVGI